MTLATRVKSDDAIESTRIPWFAFALFVLGAVIVLFLPLSLHPSSQLPDDGDALQGLTVLSWVAHQAPRAPLELFDMNLYYPHPKGLAYSEHLIPQGLVVSMMMALGASAITATNLLAALSLVAVALAVALWARELGASPIAAAAAGLVSSLSTAILEEVSRLQNLWLMWIPLGLFFLHRFFRTGSLRASFGFAACLLLQGLSGQYFLVSLPLYLAPVVLAYLFLFPERRTPSSVLYLAIPAVLLSLVLIPVEWQYLTLFSRYRFTRPLTEGTDLLRYIVPPENNIVYGWLFSDSAARTTGANHHFVGFVTVVLAGVGAASLRKSEKRFRRLATFFAILGGSFLVLSAGADLKLGGRHLGPGPFRLLYYYVPFFDYTRVPERFSAYFVFGLALLAGLGASRLGRRPALVALIFLILPLEHARRSSYARIPTGDETPEVYHWLSGQPGDFALVELPVHPRRFLRFFGYESYFSTLHWKRIPFGKPSFIPPGFEYMRHTLSGFPSREATRLLQSIGARMIVYHPHRDPDAASVIRRLHRDPHIAFVRGFPEASAPSRRLGYGGELVFQVLHDAWPEVKPPGGRPIPVQGFRFETSSEVDPLLAVDGRLETGWTSGARQEKGQFFEVDLGGEYQISRISLSFAPPYDEFPRALEVNGFHHSHRWERLVFEKDPWASARVVAQLVDDPTHAMMDLVLMEPRPLERLRLFLRETNLTDDLPEWRIPEIQVFER
ncbi:MAG: discoidin domain-containing protein [Vicinamibacteria bacterium]